jgi:catechol 2,3-dioxygenase-like lactoylglutathione lyase family enzyme
VSTAPGTTIVTGVDFVALPTHDLDAAVAFYGTTLGLPCSVHRPDRNFAEFETGNLTLSIIDAEKMGLQHTVSENAVALHVDDVAAAARRWRAAA